MPTGHSLKSPFLKNHLFWCFLSAFDMVHDPAVALEALISLGFERILTSGCDCSALEGLPVIKRLVEQVRHPLLHLNKPTQQKAEESNIHTHFILGRK